MASNISPAWDRAANLEATIHLFKAAEMAGFLAFGASVAIVRGTEKEDLAYTELELQFLRNGYSPGTAKNYLSKVKACAKNAPNLDIADGESFEDYAGRMAQELKRIFGAVRDVKMNPNAQPVPREPASAEAPLAALAMPDLDAMLAAVPSLDKPALELLALAVQEQLQVLATQEPLKAAA